MTRHSPPQGRIPVPIEIAEGDRLRVKARGEERRRLKGAVTISQQYGDITIGGTSGVRDGQGGFTVEVEIAYGHK